MSAVLEKEKLFLEFGYLIDKIKKADFSVQPFKHIIIDDFLSDQHFKEVTEAQEIKRPVYKNTEGLIDDLLASGYNVQKFPGCSISIEEYLKAYNANNWGINQELLGGFGLAFRLYEYKNRYVKKVNCFLNTPDFKKEIENKFEITKENTLETVFQKYIHGYEISPHPDIRKKAATYMLNLNPHQESEQANIHTHLLKFKEDKEYVFGFLEKKIKRQIDVGCHGIGVKVFIKQQKITALYCFLLMTTQCMPLN